jgi:hypothetical protein
MRQEFGYKTWLKFWSRQQMASYSSIVNFGNGSYSGSVTTLFNFKIMNFSFGASHPFSI